MPVQPGTPGAPHPPLVVYMARPMEPQKVHVSESAMKKHVESKKKFPELNLSEGEYVISAVKRHPIGLIQIWAGAGTVIVALVAVLLVLTSGTMMSQMGGMDGALTPMILAIPVFLIAMLVVVFAFVATYIYNANKFFLTNESVIQFIQTSLFSKRQQTVSLSNVEDASFSQDGIVPHLFNYGMIRLSTEGDETTYRFRYASQPEKQIATLNNAVEAFKNGRPVGD